MDAAEARVVGSVVVTQTCDIVARSWGFMKSQGYATGQFGKNHLGDRDEMLPSNHGFDEFYGNLYHLNAEEEPELRDYPKDPEFRKKFGPRGVIHSFADGRIEDTGSLTKKRMETIDDDVAERSAKFIEQSHAAGNPFFVWVNFMHMHFRGWDQGDEEIARCIPGVDGRLYAGGGG